ARGERSARTCAPGEGASPRVRAAHSQPTFARWRELRSRVKLDAWCQKRKDEISEAPSPHSDDCGTTTLEPRSLAHAQRNEVRSARTHWAVHRRFGLPRTTPDRGWWTACDKRPRCCS